MTIDYKCYQPGKAYDELVTRAGNPRVAARSLCRYFSQLDDKELAEHTQAVDLAIMALGITFTIYSEGDNIDRAWPLDVVPRVISHHEWMRTEEGLKQRLTALLAARPCPVETWHISMKAPEICGSKFGYCTCRACGYYLDQDAVERFGAKARKAGLTKRLELELTLISYAGAHPVHVRGRAKFPRQLRF